MDGSGEDYPSMPLPCRGEMFVRLERNSYGAGLFIRSASGTCAEIAIEQDGGEIVLRFYAQASDDDEINGMSAETRMLDEPLAHIRPAKGAIHVAHAENDKDVITFLPSEINETPRPKRLIPTMPRPNDDEWTDEPTGHEKMALMTEENVLLDVGL